MERNAFYKHGHDGSLQKGDVDKGFSESPILMEGTVRTAAQEHFYLEPSACIAAPSGEAGEIEIKVSYQEINMVQVSEYWSM